MQQLPLFADEFLPEPEIPRSTVKKLTRNQLARLSYEASCPLPFIKVKGYCHRCVFFDGCELDLSTSPPTATMQCTAESHIGSEFGYKPGLIHEGWRSIVAWVEKVYQT